MRSRPVVAPDELVTHTCEGQGSLTEGLVFCLDGEQRFRIVGEWAYECDDELAATTYEASVERPSSAVRPMGTVERRRRVVVKKSSTPSSQE